MITAARSSPPTGGRQLVADSGARPSVWAVLASALRLHQWSKNALVFVPAVTSHRFADVPTLLAAGVAFLSFSLCASALYVVNDLMDLEADRRHPAKSKRSLAAGVLPARAALVLVPALLAGSGALAATLPSAFGLVLVGYALASVTDSWKLKHFVLVDVLLLAGLYALRVFAGAAATRIPVSNWLLAFSVFLFLSLALVKRFTELRLPTLTHQRRGYRPGDAAPLAMLGTASGYAAVLVLALYVSGTEVRALYRSPELLWLVCPMLLYWISRVWLPAQRDGMASDPVVFALSDRITLALGAVIPIVMSRARFFEVHPR